MKNKKQKITDFLSGLVQPKNDSDSSYSTMEQINLNALLLTGLLFSIIMFAFSAFQLDLISIIFTFVFLILFSTLYYLARFKNFQNIWLIISIVLITLSICWIIYGGVIGSTSYLYILFLFMIIIVAKRHLHYYIFSVFLINILLLYLIEYFYGDQLIRTYSSRSAFVTDLAFTFLIVVVSTFYIMRFLKRMFDEERDKVKRQKFIIEKQNSEHISSLVYASNLQKKIISNEEQLKFLFEDYFVLFKPKDIVSGDFYWIKEKGDYGVVVVADCTGHGVPAALLSILGISLLEEVIEQLNGEWTAAEFLEKLRLKFIFHLKKDDVASKQLKDGMDLGICIINYSNSTIQFSGANRSLVMVRANQQGANQDFKENVKTDTHSLFSFKSTKNTIGFNYVEFPFVNHTMEYNKTDSFYIFSDGYNDQYDATNLKKFKIAQFKKELLKIQFLPMKEQQTYLENLHSKWKGTTEQTDDILVVGFRV